MKRIHTRQKRATRSSMIGSMIALAFALFVGVAAASESPAPGTMHAGQDRPPALQSEHDEDLWSLALLGPAAVIILVTALGLTITVSSLRAEARRRFQLDRYWKHGAMARAAATRD